jgi:hypothetical protein
MKIILSLEYIAGVVLSLYLFSLADSRWWLYLVLFFTPDIAMVGYVISSKIGAACYNFTHHLGVAVFLYVIGKLVHMPTMELVGIVWLGHLYFDRSLGYGLKYADNFKHTHIGMLP